MTARLLDVIQGTVFTAGDNAYPDGTEAEFAACYDPTWGRHKRRTRPSPGNHDYRTEGAAGYFAYFGANAGPPGLGYYSYRAGAWLVLSLNSAIRAHDGSAQLTWLRATLAEQPTRCALAYWHHPLFSSGPNGDHAFMRDMWRVLQEAGVEVAVTSHDHLYERFAPQDDRGRPDPRGIRQFVVGTGGARLYEVHTIKANSEVRASAYGVLKLTLKADGYDWEFVPVEGESFRDFGTGQCF
jgi:3',5'-cyclic AMP phosphodiesterase CpdA